jgi:hypothetical protein
MLTMTQIKNIKKMYYSKGKKVNEIVKITGHNYRTVMKYLKKDDFNQTVGRKEGDKRGRPQKIFSSSLTGFPLTFLSIIPYFLPSKRGLSRFFWGFFHLF